MCGVGKDNSQQKVIATKMMVVHNGMTKWGRIKMRGNENRADKKRNETKENGNNE